MSVPTIDLQPGFSCFHASTKLASPRSHKNGIITNKVGIHIPPSFIIITTVRPTIATDEVHSSILTNTELYKSQRAIDAVISGGRLPLFSSNALFSCKTHVSEIPALYKNTNAYAQSYNIFYYQTVLLHIHVSDIRTLCTNTKTQIQGKYIG